MRLVDFLGIGCVGSAFREFIRRIRIIWFDIN